MSVVKIGKKENKTAIQIGLGELKSQPAKVLIANFTSFIGRNCLITGAKGTGRSNTLLRVAQQALNYECKLLSLDFKSANFFGHPSNQNFIVSRENHRPGIKSLSIENSYIQISDLEELTNSNEIGSIRGSESVIRFLHGDKYDKDSLAQLQFAKDAALKLLMELRQQNCRELLKTNGLFNELKTFFASENRAFSLGLANLKRFPTFLDLLVIAILRKLADMAETSIFCKKPLLLLIDSIDQSKKDFLEILLKKLSFFNSLGIFFCVVVSDDLISNDFVQNFGTIIQHRTNLNYIRNITGIDPQNLSSLQRGEALFYNFELTQALAVKVFDSEINTVALYENFNDAW